MERITANWKIIGLVVAFVLVIVFLLVLLFPTNKTEVSDISVSPFPTATPLPTVGSQPANFVNNKIFSTQYPAGFRTEVVPTGEDNVLVVLSGSSGEKIEIQTYGKTDTSIATLTRIFTSLGYASNSASVGNIRATEFKGAFPGNPPIQTIANIFETKDKTVKIQLTYNSVSTNPVFEDSFYKTTASFIIH